MGCCGDREKLGNLRAEQKWDYINLSDFKSSSCWAPFSYGILYISLIVSIAVYAVDTFTAINLIAFDRWSGRIKPAVPFSVSRWIFAACIILSFVLLIYRWVRAIRVMKGGGVAQSYLDPLAVRIQSVRMGRKGRGWRRFLVFTELTKSKKGADYVALFTYFSFEAWLRVVFAEGPRQVVNALTLYSVMRLNLLPQGEHAAKDGHSPVIQFFINVGLLANQSQLQAVILFGMLFTLVIWVISAINLALAILMYILFLWHHVPSADGSLSKYCRRKINDRAEKVIGAKMNKALQREQRMQMRDEKNGAPVPGQIKRQPTLPVLDITGQDKLPEMPMLSRTTTTTTLPPYSSSPPSAEGLDRAPTLPDLTLDTKRPPTSRSMTASSARSTTSYSSDAPLLGSANDMGYSSSPVSPLGGTYPPPMPMNRNMSSSTQGTQRSYGSSSRAPSSQGRRTPGPDYPPRGPPLRTNTAMSNMSTASTGRRPTPGPGPSPMDRSYTPAMPPPPQNNAWPLPGPGPSPIDGSYTPNAPQPAQNFDWPLSSPDRSAPTPRPGEPTRTPTPGSGLSRNPSAGQGSDGFVAFDPSVHAQSSDFTPAPTSSYSSRGTYRGVTPASAKTSSPQDYFSQQPQQSRAPPMPRAGTAPPAQTHPSQQDDYSGSGYDDFLDDYASDSVPQSAPAQSYVAPVAPISRPTPTVAPPDQTQPRVQMPTRAATSSPISQRPAPPRSGTTTPSSGFRSHPQTQQYQPPPSQQPQLPQLQAPSQPRSQTPTQSKPQSPPQLPRPAFAEQQGSGMKHQTLKEQIAQGGQDWRANDGSAAVQGGGSSNVFDW